MRLKLHSPAYPCRSSRRPLARRNQDLKLHLAFQKRSRARDGTSSWTSLTMSLTHLPRPSLVRPSKGNLPHGIAAATARRLPLSERAKLPILRSRTVTIAGLDE